MTIKIGKKNYLIIFVITASIIACLCMIQSCNKKPPKPDCDYSGYKEKAIYDSLEIVKLNQIILNQSILIGKDNDLLIKKLNDSSNNIRDIRNQIHGLRTEPSKGSLASPDSLTFIIRKYLKK